MKKLILILIFLTASCAEKKNTNSHIDMPISLERSQMENFIILLPIVLKKSQEFISANKNKNLSDEDFNDSFYSYLYQDPQFALTLRDSGFFNKNVYAQFHNTVLENFLLITENTNIVQEAVLSIPKIQKELDTLLIKQGREPNNQSLKNTVDRVQASLTFYKNIVLIDNFYSQLNTMNQNNESK